MKPKKNWRRCKKMQIRGGKKDTIKPNLRILKIDKSLSQIKLPENKIQLFVDFFNNDIINVKEWPIPLTEGYLMLSFPSIEPSVDVIRQVARTTHMTYNLAKGLLENIGMLQTSITIYFETVNNYLNVYLYFLNEDNNINDYIQIPLDENIFGNANKIPDNYTLDIYNAYVYELLECDLKNMSKDEIRDILYGVRRYYRVKYFEMSIVILKTVFWYLVSNKTERVFTEVQEKIPETKSKKYKHKSVNKEITITTPIYDLGKVPTRKVNVLVRRREGWTYSHAFPVRGHYRHYKSGKTIFVNSYIKGEGEFIGKTYNIKPEKYVKGGD
jgi:hypothetical protein